MYLLHLGYDLKLMSFKTDQYVTFYSEQTLMNISSDFIYDFQNVRFSNSLILIWNRKVTMNMFIETT